MTTTLKEIIDKYQTQDNKAMGNVAELNPGTLIKLPDNSHCVYLSTKPKIIKTYEQWNVIHKGTIKTLQFHYNKYNVTDIALGKTLEPYNNLEFGVRRIKVDLDNMLRYGTAIDKDGNVLLAAHTP